MLSQITVLSQACGNDYIGNAAGSCIWDVDTNYLCMSIDDVRPRAAFLSPCLRICSGSRLQHLDCVIVRRWRGYSGVKVEAADAVYKCTVPYASILLLNESMQPGIHNLVRAIPHQL